MKSKDLLRINKSASMNKALGKKRGPVGLPPVQVFEVTHFNLSKNTFLLYINNVFVSSRVLINVYELLVYTFALVVS